MNDNLNETYYHFITNEIDTYFKKDETDKDKYVVCTCAKNENEYITEFIEHYLKMGFDKIFICDNNDNDSLQEILEEYVKQGNVEIFNCHGFDSFQVQFYSMFCNEGNYKWCAYFDADEFLELSPKYNSIKEFLNGIEEDCVCFNWLTFGDNGQMYKTEGSIQERFPLPLSPINYRKENLFIKSIVKGGYNRFSDCWFNGSHIPTTSNKDVRYNIGGYFVTDEPKNNFYPLRYKNGYLKHYYTKSFEEWCNKANRGWPDGTKNLKMMNYFICNEKNAQIPNINYYSDSLFDGTQVPDKELIESYSVIQFFPKYNNMYNYTLSLFSHLKSTTNHTFILTSNFIDDAYFNMALEYAFRTNNTICFGEGQDELWKIFLNKNNNNAETYYIIFC